MIISALLSCTLSFAIEEHQQYHAYAVCVALMILEIEHTQ